MISLAPYIAAGWGGAPGAYLHKGRVYMTGVIFSLGGSPPTTSTILTSLPPELRPSGSTSIVLPALSATTDACNATLNLAERWGSTVAGSTWSLDDPIPASVNTTPSGETWYYEEGLIGELIERFAQYKEPFSLVLVVGNASWPVAPVADSPALSSLAAYLGPDVTDDASEYAIHGTRVHLGGAWHAARDGAAEALSSMPPEATDGIPMGFADYTTASVLGNPIAMEVLHTFLEIDNDSPIVPAGDTPPLRTFNRALRGTGPRAAPGEARLEEIVEGFTSECLIVQCPPHANLVDHCGEEIEEHPIIRSFDLGEIIATMFLPPPDWFTVQFSVVAQATGDVTKTGDHSRITCFRHDIICIPPGGGAPEFRGDVEGGCPETTGPRTLVLSPPALGNPFTGVPSVGHLESTEGEEGSLSVDINGFILGSGYVGGPQLGILPQFFWPGAGGGIVSFTVEFHNWHKLEVIAHVAITPYYERRQIGVHAGDLIDLSRTGWEGEGPNLGDMTIGNGVNGSLPSRKTVGRAA